MRHKVIRTLAAHTELTFIVMVVSKAAQLPKLHYLILPAGPSNPRSPVCLQNEVNVFFLTMIRTSLN